MAGVACGNGNEKFANDKENRPNVQSTWNPILECKAAFSQHTQALFSFIRSKIFPCTILPGTREASGVGRQIGSLHVVNFDA